MTGASDFDRRIGRMTIPTADPIPRETTRLLERELPDLEVLAGPYKICSFTPKEGCYSLTFKPTRRFATLFPTVYKGTLRLETIGSEVVVSADLYRFQTTFPLKFYPIPQKYQQRWANLTIDREFTSIGTVAREFEPVGELTLPKVKAIPLYPRDKYFSYLQGVSINLTTIAYQFQPCTFSIAFDEFYYQHPATGFDGSFPTTPDRRLRMVLAESGTADLYEGDLYEGSTLLGSVELCWISSFFRRAELVIHRLEGAEIPQAVPHPSGSGTEDFGTIFATAGWHLSVTRNDDAIALPGSLTGNQDPNDCWDSDNSHDLMDSLPGYAPADLDTRWRAHLVAIPADLGCARGRMFDTGVGDVNDIAREGAVTHSHDGYPAGDGVPYGTAMDDLQKDHPRAFLRSAAHEVGHTFNQIHQDLEAGIDNSIMTTTPDVANVLGGAGDDFPDDIDLSFNATVRRHLIHLPDPAVRPGAIDFFGNAVVAPEADANFFDGDDLELEIEVKKSLKLGEPAHVEWRLTNHSHDPLPVPVLIDWDHQVARISVTRPDGSIRFMPSFTGKTCTRTQIVSLEPGEGRGAEAVLFWGKNGFAFDTPGQYRIDVILLWHVERLVVGAKGFTHVWIEFPVSQEENDVAALMLDEEVGKLIQSRRQDRYKGAADRTARVLSAYPKHPACRMLEELREGGHGKEGA